MIKLHVLVAYRRFPRISPTQVSTRSILAYLKLGCYIMGSTTKLWVTDSVSPYVASAIIVPLSCLGGYFLKSAKNGFSKALKPQCKSEQKHSLISFKKSAMCVCHYGDLGLRCVCVYVNFLFKRYSQDFRYFPIALVFAEYDTCSCLIFQAWSREHQC